MDYDVTIRAPFERGECPRCGWLLPVHVSADACAVCAASQEDAEDERRCCCTAPLRLRLYLGTWACVCGGLVR